ncbi:hypothetical protein [Flavobacterium sp. 2]|uniref:hypothetical protein n=1 Tax=Flavobacterium sp. 2 TaxID=308053 RepID=UPI003CF18D49
MKNKLLPLFLFLGSYAAYSQVGIGTPMPNSSAQLEVVASDKGVLIPRVNLTGSTDVTTIKNGNVNSLLVFNTASIFDITPGYYYWYANKWNRLVISNEISASPGTVVFNPATSGFTFLDAGGASHAIDFSSIIAANQTVTTLTNNGAGSYTYKNEAGADVNIDVVGDVKSNFSSIINDPSITSLLQQISNTSVGSVTFDSATNVFSYTDAAGNPQTVDISAIVKGNETLTTLTNNGAGSYTYKNEAGADVNIDVVGDVKSNFSSIINDPSITSLLQQISNKSVGSVTFDSATNVFSYTDAAGNPQTVDISAIVKGNETLTTLTNNGAGSYTYKNEAGADVNIDVVGDVKSNFSSIINDPSITSLLQQISNKSVGSVTFDSATNVFSYTDAAGNPQTVDISAIVKGNETLTTLTNNGAGSYTYKNEAGADVNIDVVGDVKSNFSSIINDPSITSLLQQISNKSVGSVTFDSATNVFSYTDAAGNPQTVDINAIVKGNETLTTLTNNGAGSYTYKNEAGADVNIDVVGDVKSNFSSIINDPSITSLLQQISNTSVGSVTFDSATNVFSYTDAVGNPQTVDISAIVKGNETLTTIVNNGAGSYTYKNEAGADVNIDVVGDVKSSFSSIVNDPSITSILQQISSKSEGSVTFDSATNVFSYTDSAGNPQTVDISAIVKGNETLTTIVNNGAGSYTYKNEAGADVNIDVVGDVKSSFSSIVNDPSITSILQQISSKSEGSVTFDSATNVFSYTDSAGNPQTVDISAIVKGNETLTTLVNNGAGSYTYKNEAGADVNIDVVGDVKSSFSSIVNDPSITSILQQISSKSEGSVTFDSATNVFSYTDSAGNPQTVDISAIVKGNETLTTIVNNGAGSYTYKNEAGADVNIDVVGDVKSSFSSIVNDPSITSILQQISSKSEGSVTFDSATNVFSYTDSAGNPQTVDISAIVKGNETKTNLNQAIATGIITYTNEDAIAQTAIIRSSDAGNIITIGTDGGALLTPASISNSTAVSNTSSGNGLSTTVNGITGSVVPIINTNETSLTGATLITAVNGVASTGLDLTPALASATTVSNTSNANSLTTTVNGVAGTAVDIVNSNVLSVSGNSLTSTINGEASNAVDLSSAIAAGTTNALSLAGNTLTSNVNGVSVTSDAVSGVSNASANNTSTVTVNGITSAGAPIVNSNVLSVSGNSLTSTINGEASNAIDLTSVIASGTTNALSLAGNTLTSNVNGVSVTSDAVSGVSNASANNTSTVTVNGITSSGAPIVTSNETSLTGATLVTTVNGVASTGLDLTPALASASTVSNLSSGNDLSTTVNGVTGTIIPIINTNETSLTGSTLITTVNGVVSTGLDLTPALASATTVSNVSSGNDLSTTVNGVTGTIIPIINSNETSVTGATLVTTVNGVASTGLDLTSAIASGTTNALSLAGNTLTSNVNGVSVTSDAVSGVSNTSANNTSTVTVNGITSSGAPIVNSNETSLTGATLVTTVNGVASTGLDLTPALASATTVSNISSGNDLSTTVNGVTGTVIPIINTNETSLTGSTLITTVNGVVSTGLDLTSAIAAGTTNALSLAGNTLTSNVNGVSVTSDAVSGVSNASANNVSTVTVNGITSSGAPIVNSNETSLTGTNLVTTVNGVASTGLDLTPALASATTVSNISSGNALSTTVNGVTGTIIPIINSNETSVTGAILVTTVNGVASTGLDLTSAIASGTTNALSLTGNTLTSNVNGVSVTSDAVSGVSNASANNTSTITVNGITSTGAPIVNSNVLSVSGNSLTSTINGEASNTIDLTSVIAAGTTNALSLAGNTLTSNVNGVSVTSDAVSGVSNASANNTSTVTVNGITSAGAPIVNSNETSLTGATLVTTINGVASTGLDLTPALASATTVSNTSNANSLTTTVNGVAGTVVDIVNSNVLSVSGNSLTSTINGEASNAIDLSSAIAAGTTNVLSLAGNTLTSNVNGVSVTSDAVSGVSNASANNTSTVTVNGIKSAGAPIVNSNETSLTGATLVTTVNGVASTGLDLTPALASATTVSNISSGNDLSTMVNGVTGTVIPIINTNETSLTGATLITTVNGVASTGLDLTPAIKSNETITVVTPIVNSGNSIATYVNEAGGTPVDIKETVTTQSQDLSTGTITFTNEAGTAVTSKVISTDAGNLIAVGADGGGFVDSAIIKANETITAISPVVTTGNTIATYTNEAGGTPVDVKETVTSLKDVVTQSTDPAGQLFDVHTLTYTDEANNTNAIDLSLLVKGVETLTSLVYDGANHSLIYNDEKGITTEFKMTDLIGESETLTKLEVNATTGNLDYTDEHQQLHQLNVGGLIREPWFSSATNTGATLNTEDIYTNGWVGIGYTSPSAANEKLRVNGSISTVNSYYADYVFEDYFKGFSNIKADYKFKHLAEVEDYIKKNNHLPGITPINELEKTKEGYAFNMSELSIQLLEKTEEMYLHIIEQNKVNEAQSKEIEAKNKEINELKEATKAMNLRLEKLEKLLEK